MGKSPSLGGCTVVSFGREDGTNQENIPTGNLFCGELSKLISAKTYKARYFFPMGIGEDSVPVYVGTDINEAITSSDPQTEYFDMLSVYPVKYDDVSDEALDDNSVECKYQTKALYGGTADSGHYLYYNFDVPIVEFEFEPVKSSISKSKERGIDTRSDGKLITSFKALNLRDSGIKNAEIYNTGNRLFMILEVDASFSFEKKSKMDAKTQKFKIGKH